MENGRLWARNGPRSVSHHLPPYRSKTFLTSGQVSGDDTVYTKVLSTTAKAIIKEDIKSNKYISRRGNREPAYMAPSPNPEDYSHVRVIGTPGRNQRC